MNYQRIYDEFIADRRLKEPTLKKGYERHHIIPKALGGTNLPSNLIKLSLGDHLFAHLLLAKTHGGLMATAFVLMLNHERLSGRRSRLQYINARNEHRRLISEIQSTEAACNFKREFMRGRQYALGSKRNDEWKLEQSNRMARNQYAAGHKRSPEHMKACYEGLANFNSKPEVRAAASERMKKLNLKKQVDGNAHD